MTLILCFFGDGGNRGKGHGRRMIELKTERYVIMDDDIDQDAETQIPFVRVFILSLARTVEIMYM